MLNSKALFLFLSLILLTCTACRQKGGITLGSLQETTFLENQAQQWLDSTSNHGVAIGSVTFQQDGHFADPESYELSLKDGHLRILSNDLPGALYAIADLQNQLPNGTPSLEKTFTPTFPVRAIKFNLPWSAYRESASMSLHEKTCRDPEFWRVFLDMMFENRFNTLLLYNKHPFPFMIKLDEYPEANPFSTEEMQQWMSFWQELFQMAHERGIEVFIVNWNIIVSPSFAQTHQISEYNDTSQITRDYTKKSVTALINQYPGLAGLGVTLADWMNGMSPVQKETWIQETFIDGIKEANREVKFLHRAVLSGSSDEMRKILDIADFDQSAYVEVKFNWSHGHSTPDLLITHASEEGEVNTGFWDPAPQNYHIQWMIRNEDFFILPWGEPEFIRNHIHANAHPFVNGYHIGSEGYIPALNYLDKSDNAPVYAFERQWLFYKLWGKLLYDKNTGDDYFVDFINKKFATDQGINLLKAYTYASKMPLILASFFKSTWDYTLYAEGFLAPMLQSRYGLDDKQSPFISLEEIMNHETLDTNYLSIREAFEYEQRSHDPQPWQRTPGMLAMQLFNNADSVFYFNGLIRNSGFENPDLLVEMEGLEMWAYLSRYFAHKLMAGTFMVRYETERNQDLESQVIQQIQEAIMVWQKLADLGAKNYREVPYWEGGVFNQDTFYNNFSWKKYNKDVQNDLEYIKQITGK